MTDCLCKNRLPLSGEEALFLMPAVVVAAFSKGKNGRRRSLAGRAKWWLAPRLSKLGYRLIAIIIVIMGKAEKQRCDLKRQIRPLLSEKGNRATSRKLCMLTLAQGEITYSYGQFQRTNTVSSCSPARLRTS